MIFRTLSAPKSSEWNASKGSLRALRAIGCWPSLANTTTNGMYIGIVTVYWFRCVQRNIRCWQRWWWRRAQVTQRWSWRMTDLGGQEQFIVWSTWRLYRTLCCSNNSLRTIRYVRYFREYERMCLCSTYLKVLTYPKIGSDAAFASSWRARTQHALLFVVTLQTSMCLPCFSYFFRNFFPPRERWWTVTLTKHFTPFALALARWDARDRNIRGGSYPDRINAIDFRHIRSLCVDLT